MRGGMSDEYIIEALRAAAVEPRAFNSKLFVDAAGRLAAKVADVEKMRARKDGAYHERNQLVAALSKLFPSALERHPDEDTEWEDDWRWVVRIDGPTGQLSWHIHDTQLGLFDHLRRTDGHTWDGHDTAEKYRRLAALEPK